MKNENQMEKVEQAKGRPLLHWVGKKPIESVQFYPAQEIEVYGDKSAKDFNKLFWGDNLQVLSHFLKEYRGKIDLIYIDPPFDSKADYVKKVKIRGEKIIGVEQSLLEEKQYTDIWEREEYLQFIYERLVLMRELLTENGSIFVHCDWHKSSYIRLILDEVFGVDRFINEIVWWYPSGSDPSPQFNRKHDNIFWYGKGKSHTFNFCDVAIPYTKEQLERFDQEDEKGKFYWNTNPRGEKVKTYQKCGIGEYDVWNIGINATEIRDLAYPTAKPQKLLERIIKASTKEGDIVADFFMGSGTTQAVAQKLGRRWIGCDINKGAIQTTTKRLNQIIEDQQKEKIKDFKGSYGFKVLNVNDYDVFKNEVLAKEIVMEMYGVDPIKRSYFDGKLGKDFVKIMPMNRVLNKMDIGSILKNIQNSIGDFTVKSSSKAKESVYEEKVRIICSGVEYDVINFIKKGNKTGVVVEINDVLESTRDLVFKEYPESKIDVKAKDKKLSVDIKEFYSPLLMRKLEIENSKVLNKKEKAKVQDFKQIIDSVAIDVDYNGKLFNAEIIDLPDKKEVIKAKYSWEYPKKGKYTVAIKVVDVLGEEFFETFEVNA
jgi:site-specific DNA-methyltransferase (adenine-specific)/adenine-specific DNA-methyltransferase